MHVCSATSLVSDSLTPWTVGCQASQSGIFQARILEWVAMPSSRGSSQPRDQTHISCVSCIVGGFFTAEQPRLDSNWYKYADPTKPQSEAEVSSLLCRPMGEISRLCHWIFYLFEWVQCLFIVFFFFFSFLATSRGLQDLINNFSTRDQTQAWQWEHQVVTTGPRGNFLIQ